MSADVDIDLPDRHRVLELIQHIPARQENSGHIQTHNTGIYVTDIPYDAVHGCAAIDYRQAEDRGYFKIDLLNVGVYKLIKDPEHYQAMLDREPNWQRLWTDPVWAQQLVHVGNYINLLAQMKPDSIPRMAAFIAVIRPGKAHLQGRPWTEVFESVWDGDASQGFVFKKSHSVSYARLVTLHMNLLDATN